MTDQRTAATIPCVNCANLMGSIRHMQAVMERQKDEHERRLIERDQEILDLRRANRANKSRWKNARRDFLDVKAERDALREHNGSTPGVDR